MSSHEIFEIRTEILLKVTLITIILTLTLEIEQLAER
jgi:hypothetical protein